MVRWLDRRARPSPLNKSRCTIQRLDCTSRHGPCTATGATTSSGAMRFLGASTLLVPPMTLARTHPESPSASGSGGGSDNDNGGDAMTGATTGKEVQFWDFELEYTPLKTGFVPSVGCGSCFWKIECTVQKKHIHKGDLLLPWY